MNRNQGDRGYSAQCRRAWVAQRWIEEDIGRGILPPGVNCFSALHDYVDGHGYLFDKYLGETRIGTTLDWQSWSLQEIIDHIAPVCEAVDAWLRNQRQGNAVDYLQLKEGTRFCS
ncbi:MAG: hypothetical protein EA349_08345 [Halomonadaceae bacterium]|nr:MAG: hypothetical protein EA349_08345 [Halomonadaceae bacterium]